MGEKSKMSGVLEAIGKSAGGLGILEALGKDKGSMYSVGFADRGPMLFDFSTTRRLEESILFVQPPAGEGSGTDDDCLLTAFVGDALIEPFWPEGLGIMRGFFAALDASSSILLWSLGATTAEVEEHADEAFTQLKTLAAATRPRVLHNKESMYGLMPDTRYKQFKMGDDIKSMIASSYMC